MEKYTPPPPHAEVIRKALDEAVAAGNISPEEAQANYEAYLAGALGKVAVKDIDKKE